MEVNLGANVATERSLIVVPIPESRDIEFRGATEPKFQQ
jgi:hypothetical protein